MNKNPFGLSDSESGLPSQRATFSKDQAVNPYAATSAVSETEGYEEDVETFRRAYLSHEASIRAVGLLYMIPGVLFLVFAAVFTATFVGWLVTGQPENLGRVIGGTLGLFALYLIAGSLQVLLGYKLRKFNPIARVIVVVFSILGLVAIPIGTVISIYVIWLLYGQKGKVVFSHEYQLAIEQTPHIKYKTSSLVVFLGLLLLALLALALLSTLFIA